MKIDSFIYHPRLGGYRFTDKSCAFGITAYQDKNGRWHRYQQCDKKITAYVGEYGFCKKHANLVLDVIENSD